jgi:hypothetical protein
VQIDGCEHTFVSTNKHRLATLDAAIACRPAALRVEEKDGQTVEWLTRAGLLIDAEDGTVAPTHAPIHNDELAKT